MTDPQPPSPYGPPAGRQPAPQPAPQVGVPAAQQPPQPGAAAQPPAYAQSPYTQQQPYAQQNPYAAVPPYGFAPPRPRTNPLAIVSLCASGSIVVLFVLLLVFPAIGLLPSVAGVVTGHIALSQIKRTGEQGRALAITGLAIGYAVAGLLVLGFVGMIAFFGIVGATGGFS